MNETTNINTPKYETNEQIRMELIERFGDIDKELSLMKIKIDKLNELTVDFIGVIGIFMALYGFFFNWGTLANGIIMVVGGFFGALLGKFNKTMSDENAKKIKLQQAEIVFQNSSIKDNKEAQAKILQEFKL